MNQLVELVKAGTASGFVHTMNKDGWHSVECKVQRSAFCANAADPDVAATSVVAQIETHQKTVQETQARRDEVESRVRSFAEANGGKPLLFDATKFYGESCPPSYWAVAQLQVGAKSFARQFGHWDDEVMRAALMDEALRWIEQTETAAAPTAAD